MVMESSAKDGCFYTHTCGVYMPDYTGMIYWTVPDDGAPFRCMECGGRSNAKDMVLVQTPIGRRLMLHRECVDADWLSHATYQGMLSLDGD